MSLSAVLPVVHIYGLVSQLVITKDVSPSIQQLKTKVMAELRLQSKLDNLDTNEVSVFATALDPQVSAAQVLK